jgi:hypothetical protein
MQGRTTEIAKERKELLLKLKYGANTNDEHSEGMTSQSMETGFALKNGFQIALLRSSLKTSMLSHRSL